MRTFVALAAGLAMLGATLLAPSPALAADHNDSASAPLAQCASYQVYTGGYLSHSLCATLPYPYNTGYAGGLGYGYSGLGYGYTGSSGCGGCGSYAYGGSYGCG